MSSGSIDPHFTDRCPQYKTVTTVLLGNLAITVLRREQTFKFGPDEEVKKAVTRAYDLHHNDARLLAVSICSLPRVYSIQILSADKQGVEFSYLY
jgi:hypothetical protein